MEVYKNFEERSNVFSYDFEVDYVVVKLNVTRRPYRYSYGRSGKQDVENVNQLAKEDNG